MPPVLRLVGRQAEAGALGALLDGSAAGPGCLVLRGEAGVGKIAIWLTGRDIAAAHGYQVLSCRPAAAEARLSYGGLADLLAGAAGTAVARLPPVLRRAIEAVLLVGEDDHSVDERAVAAGFFTVLRLLAAEGPVCVAIDDVPWLDAASLVAVCYAFQRLDHEPVASLIAVRGATSQWVRRTMPRAGTRRRRRRARPQRLPAVAALPPRHGAAASATGESAAGVPGQSAIRARTRVCPAAAGWHLGPGEELPLPSDLQQLLRRRLRGLGGAARDVACAVATLADPTGARRRAVALRPSAVWPAALAVLTPARRRGCMPVLPRLRGQARNGARHLALGTDVPDDALAATLETAAGAAAARGALRLPPVSSLSRRCASPSSPGTADTGRRLLLDRALGLAPRGDERATVLMHLADCTWRTRLLPNRR